MKQLILIAAALLISGSAVAQNQRATAERNVNGGYGAMDFRVTSFDGEGAGTFGTRGAWIGNHTFGIGGAGYGFTTDDITLDQRLEGGYGGILLEYYLAPQQAVQFNAGVVVGLGWISRVTGSHEDDNHVVLDESGFFVTEPMIGVSTNVASLVRLGLEASYRFVGGSDLGGFSDSDLSAFAVGLSLRIGIF